jgi:transcriptional regulator with XRE-family HTH domain
MFSPALCRAARGLLGWSADDLASAAQLGVSTIWRFEGDSPVRSSSVQSILTAFEGAGIEFIAAGGQSLDGGPGLRTTPMDEPEVVTAKEAVEIELDNAEVEV